MHARIAGILKQAVMNWIDNRSASSAAAIAFYAVFSAVPLLLVVIQAASGLLGEATASRALFHQLEFYVGPQGAYVIQQALASASESSHQGGALVVGAVALLLGTTAIFSQVQTSLNIVWNVPSDDEPIHRQILRFLWRRLLAFAMAVVFGLLLLTFLVMGVILHRLVAQYSDYAAVDLMRHLRLVNWMLSFLLMGLLLAMIYKILPDTPIRWGEVWIAALITAGLLMVGDIFISMYISHMSIGSAYGAAGSLVLVLVWVYYSAMAFLLGAEIAHCVACGHIAKAGDAAPGQS